MDARAEKSFMGPSFYSLDLALRAKVVKSTPRTTGFNVLDRPRIYQWQ